MGDLTKNLSRHEFECECGCGFDTVDYALVVMLQGAVDHFIRMLSAPVKIIITGPNRCLYQDEKTQRDASSSYKPYSSESTHKDAKAADFKMLYQKGGDWINISPLDVYRFLDKKYPDSIGLGLYSNRVHLDSRKIKARWNKTKLKV
jgi:hypothetical protein